MLMLIILKGIATHYAIATLIEACGSYQKGPIPESGQSCRLREPEKWRRESGAVALAIKAVAEPNGFALVKSIVSKTVSFVRQPDLMCLDE